MALLAGLILLLLALAVVAIGSRQPQLPAPFGLAANGIVVSSHDGDIYTVDPATSQSTPLALGDGFDFSPIFSRDGTKFVFLRSDGPLADPAILTLMVANPDGSGLHPVTPPTESIDWFDWSPTGTQIAYVARGQLWVAETTGGLPTMLPGAKPAHFPTWLPPDGREIIFRLETVHPAIMAIRPDGTGLRPVSTRRANNEFDYQGLGVSPDGSKITFTRWSSAVPDIDNGWLPRVYALDVKKGEEMQFPTAEGTGQVGAAHSPDGKLVAYARIYRETRAFQLVIANANGSGNERTLGPRKSGTADGSTVDATWAFTPDGTGLLVRYGNDDSGSTHLLPLDGSPESVLLDTGRFEFVDMQRLAP